MLVLVLVLESCALCCNSGLLTSVLLLLTAVPDTSNVVVTFMDGADRWRTQARHCRQCALRPHYRKYAYSTYVIDD